MSGHLTQVRIAIVAEAEADQRMVCGLIDRKIVHHAPDWFDRDNQAAQLDALRLWCGLEPGTSFTRWNRLSSLTPSTSDAKVPGIRALGFKRTGAIGYDHAAMRTVLVRFQLAQPRYDALIISRDLDDQHAEERYRSLEIGEQEILEAGVLVCLAAQVPMREAWVLNGFVARTATERAVLKREIAHVRFDPCANSHRLTAAARSELRSAKRVLKALTGGKREREEACWTATAWTLLRARGKATGLTAFLEAVRSRLVRLVTGEPLH